MEVSQLVTAVKQRNNITDTKHDAYLQAVAPDHLDYAKVYTNNDFLNADGTETIPGPVLSFVADACQYGMNPTGLQARSLGDVSYNYEIDYTPAMLRKLRPYKRVRF